MSLLSIVVKALDALDLDDDVNRLVIDRAVNVARSRPHPWSTKHDYISWSGLTDRTFNARLLPAKPYPAEEKRGSRRPPLADVAALFGLRAGQSQRLCPKSTGLFPAFAQYLTDGFIRTQLHNDPARTDRRRTTSNHEIDMSPLYGRTPTQTQALRTMSEMPGARGRLKGQKIGGEDYPKFLFGADGQLAPEFVDAAGEPILDMPLGLKNVSPEGRQTLFAVGGDRVNATPQTAMMNTLFFREHNRLAGLLEQQHREWDDERVFETARNIIIVLFIKIVVEEYINHINTTEFPLQADPKAAWKAKWNKPNWMTVEFSLLYRWHGLVTENVTWGDTTLPGKSILLNNRLLIESGLAQSFVNVSANRAARLGLENSASFLLEAEQSTIGQARSNNVASYNDYRVAMGMEPARNFAAIVGSSDDLTEQGRLSALAARLHVHYGTPDNVEFYVGLFAERTEKNGPLPELIAAMVAMDAFSQALTNPLLSEHVWGNPNNRKLAFTDMGLEVIDKTKRLRDILVRNTNGLGDRFVGMTRREWRRQ
ncbi:peroxidase family protein [Sphingomonas radiodurans]|uniref:peroxidase family protein n=1 Tax=Sphingomonas radiodurans TaxID=2890321 RepID=UPI001E489F97|nr:peroxidase family protein [Sphingomonas radiodurans]WBH17375.1 heme peroxidase [Sphingomonas radiodurans]